MSDADLSLRIEHAIGETSELVVPTPVAVDDQQPTLASIRTERALDRIARAEATVFRDEWLAIEEDLDRRDDEFYIEDADGTDIFGGRFDDDQIRGATVSVLIVSFERDARDVPPEPSFSRADSSDQTIATDLIDLMPAPLSIGIVEETTAALDFDDEQATPGEMLRDLASTTGADVRFRADGTVDYLAERGDDCGETLSPQSGALIGDPRIRESGRASPTAVRVVSDSDAQTFADSDVTTGEREVVLVDELDSTSESRLQTRADSLADEIAGGDRYLEIDVGVDPEAVIETPSVGDRCPVRLPAAGIDTTLRVIERDRVIDADGDRLDRVLFANRLETLQGR